VTEPSGQFDGEYGWRFDPTNPADRQHMRQLLALPAGRERDEFFAGTEWDAITSALVDLVDDLENTLAGHVATVARRDADRSAQLTLVARLLDIDDTHIAYWESDPNVEAARKAVIGGPPQEPDCTPAPAVLTALNDKHVVCRVPMHLHPVALAQLARGGTLWLSTWDFLPMFMVEVAEPGVAAPTMATPNVEPVRPADA